LSTSTQIGFSSSYSDTAILKELLSPWHVSFTTPDKADISIFYRSGESVSKKSIVLPYNGHEFNDWVKKQNLKLKSNFHTQIKVDISNQTSLTISSKQLFDYEEPSYSNPHECSSTEFYLNSDQVLLKIDPIKEFTNIVDPALNGKTSILYHILTGLPLRYDAAPKRIRDFVMGDKKEDRVFDYCDKLPLDALRFILVKTIERLSGKVLLRKKWRGENGCVAVTHDIDTEKGLDRANQVKKLEEKYDITSAWYIPTKHYPLNYETVKELANHGEVGVHGTKHSGNLVRLSSQKLFSQFSNAKDFLEKISSSTIQGFRSPLLQHNSTILAQLKKAGYTYDTSIPTWEPKHPQTMSPFGIGTVFPLNINGLVELPVSIIQDHQLLYVSGLTARETLSQWLSFKSVVNEVGGCNIFLSHPEYKFFDPENIFLYEDFLNNLAADKDSWVTTPNNLAFEYRTSNSC
jgi:peptidoglycan/xylan/chitin deacetylase (PgdA/CDA1 family)